MSLPAHRFEPARRQSGTLRVRVSRVPLVAPVLVTYQGARFQGTTLDLGLGGAFIETLIELDLEARVELSLALPEVIGEVQLPAIVRWLKPGGIGVHFLELGVLQTRALTSIIESAKRASSEGAPELPMLVAEGDRFFR